MREEPPPITGIVEKEEEEEYTVTSSYTQDISLDEGDLQISICGYRRSIPGTIIYWILIACTAGLFYIVDAWFHVFFIWLALRRATLEDATYIQVLNANQKHASLELVSRVEYGGSLKGYFTWSLHSEDKESDQVAASLRIVTFRHHRLVFHSDTGKFVPASMWKHPQWCLGHPTGAGGLEAAEIEQRQKLFGPCLIDIEEKSYLRLLWDEALNPFYIFQVASIVIWCCEDYYYYASAIFVISAISILSTLVTTKRTMRKVREMAAYVVPLHTLRDGNWQVIPSSELVPGDIIDVAASQLGIMPCDAMLLEGDCIANESMLTGESIPESKVALETPAGRALQDIDLGSQTFRPTLARHVLFEGTNIIRARGITNSVYDRNPTSTHSCASSSTVKESESTARQRAVAMVLRTGFCTTKGSLVRSILHPRPTKFRFYTDAFRFIGILAAIAVIGFIVNSINLHRLGVSAKEIAKKALDLITVVVPPALPASMSIGMAFAARRLKTQGIFCISPSRINVASKVAVLCFDKTGTLTEDGLDLLGVHVVDREDSRFRAEGPQTDIEQIAESDRMGNRLQTVHALASCHSLRIIDGTAVGDPLEVKMFESTGWQIKEDRNEQSTTTIICPSTGNTRGLEMLRCFEFSPDLRLSSVIVRQLDTTEYTEVYVKGAPEAILSICQPDSVPRDFDSTLDYYTQKGYRVIALAAKVLEVFQDDMLDRSKAESNLTFMGFLVFENRLKPTTVPVLQELREAQIRVVMCTGDNPLTAVSVARECQLVASQCHVFVPHLYQDIETSSNNSFSYLARLKWRESSGLEIELDSVTFQPRAISSQATEMAERLTTSGHFCLAMTGTVFQYMRDHGYGSDTWKHMLMRTAVYARMSPEQKAEMIEELQELGYIAGFCGDGANDTSALKSADVGISLSEAEASVAAPFTSRTTDIQCVTKLLKEGRCSIATSFSCFKFMALYSIVQFTTCCLLYIYNVNLTDGQYLFVDMFTILPLAVSMDRAKPFSKLVTKRPSSSLRSKKVITSLLGNVLFVIGFQIAVFFMTESQSWYQKPGPAIPGDPDSTPKTGDLNTSIYLFSIFQYLFAGVIFNIGPPYRQPAYRNYIYVGVVGVLLAFDLWVLLVPVNGFFSLFGLMHTKVSWRFVILAMAAANFCLCYLCEWLVFPRLAIPLAKICRLVGMLFKKSSRMSKDGDGGGLWKRLGQRQNRKEYKLILNQIVPQGIPRHNNMPVRVPWI